MTATGTEYSICPGSCLPNCPEARDYLVLGCGHSAAKCLAPAPQPAARVPTPIKLKKSQQKGQEKSSVALQVIEVSSPSSEGAGTLIEEDQQSVLYQSEDEGESSPIVSGAIRPLSISVRTVVLKLGAWGETIALIDSCCTWC